jgi:hypothetical protein
MRRNFLQVINSKFWLRTTTTALVMGALCHGPAIGLAQTQPLPRADIEVRVPVKSVEGKQVAFDAGWQNQLAVGMVLNLVNGEGVPQALVKLSRVEARRAFGEVVANFTSVTIGTVGSEVHYAVAPVSLAITALDKGSLNFLLPRGNRVLQPGHRLSVVRDNEVIALADFIGYSPVAANIVWQKPGTGVRIGDVLWAYQAKVAPAPLSAVSPPSVITPSVVEPPRPTAPVVSDSSSLSQGAASATQSTSTTTVNPLNQTVPAGVTSPVAADSAVSGVMDNGGDVSRPMGGIDNGIATPATSPEAVASTDVFTRPQSPTSDSAGALKLSTGRPFAAIGQSLSRNGATGLIRMPSADVTGDGKVQVSVFGDTKSPNLARLGNTTTYAATIGFLPRVEFGVGVGNERQNKDLTFNAKIQLVREKGNRPALALGVTEIKKLADLGPKPTYYAALGKSFVGERVRLTAGVLNQAAIGTDVFGGVEVGLTRNLAAVLEHDTQDFNYGVRASLFNNRAHVAAQHLEGRWSYSLGFNVGLGNRSAAVPPPVDLPRLGTTATAVDAARTVQEHLIELGLENVAVRIWQNPSPGTVVAASTPLPTTDVLAASNSVVGANAANTGMEVTYENRSFPHNELDALANVLATVAVYAPEQVGVVNVVIQRAAVPIIRISCPLDSYRRFMSGHIDAKSLSTVFDVSYDVSARNLPGMEVLADTGTRARSYGHADLFLRPGIRTQLATDFYVLGIGLSLQPELDVPIARGLGFNARADIPLAGPLKPQNTTVDRVALNYSAKLGKYLLSRSFAGRFPTERDGFWTELLLTPKHSQLRGRVAAGWLDGSYGTGNRTTAYIGEARYYMPRYDLTARVSGGRFINDDKGITGALVRRFGDTEVGVEVRSTNLGRLAGIQLGIPLGPKYLSNAPDAFRLRPPDFLSYNQRSLLGKQNFIDVLGSIASEPAVGGEASRSLLDRDRLNRAYLLRSLPELRNIRLLPGTNNHDAQADVGDQKSVTLD